MLVHGRPSPNVRPQRVRILVQVAIYIVGNGLAEIAISTNPMATIYRNLYEKTGRRWAGSLIMASTWEKWTIFFGGGGECGRPTFPTPLGRACKVVPEPETVGQH